MHTIGEVSKRFGIHDKEGLFFGLTRQSGRRLFGETELEALRVIECLKASGMEIREIRQFMLWCQEGPSTFEKRKQLFESRRAAVEAEIAHLRKTLDMLEYKCWYYASAIRDGNEDRLRALSPEELPPAVRQHYESAHREWSAPVPEGAAL